MNGYKMIMNVGAYIARDFRIYICEKDYKINNNNNCYFRLILYRDII